MNGRNTIAASVFVLALWHLSLAPAMAQELPTPTPNAAGAIIVSVQPGDTLWSIAARAGLSLDKLLALNGLAEDAVLVPGQMLLIGQVTLTPTPTATLPPTPTLPPPTPTQTLPPKPRTAVCLLAFTDLNMNGRQDDGEPLQSGVAFTVYNETAVVDNYTTNSITEPHCLENLSPGIYNITRSVRPNETLTTDGDWVVTLLAGEMVQVDFGSFTANDPVITPTATAPASAANNISPGAESTARPRAISLIILIGLIGAGVLFLAGWKKIR